MLIFVVKNLVVYFVLTYSLSADEESTLWTVLALACTKVSSSSHTLLAPEAYDNKVMDGNWSAWSASMNETVPLFVMRLLERSRRNVHHLISLCQVLTCLSATAFSERGLSSVCTSMMMM